MDASTGISVVVISRNEGRELARTVENFDDTLPAGAEIIVIDDGSTDGSADRVARRRGRIRIHRVTNYGVARARNLGARQARGGVIVYADAHLRLEPNWWRPMLDVLDDPNVGGVAPAITGFHGGRVGYGLTFRDARLEVRWRRRKPRGPIAAPIIPGCCFATRRDVIEATGGWDDRQLQRGNVDNEGCVRFWMLGMELMITPTPSWRTSSANDRRTPSGGLSSCSTACVWRTCTSVRSVSDAWSPACGIIRASVRRWRLSPTAMSPSAAGSSARVACGTMTGIANDSISSGRREDVTQQRSATNGEEEEGNQEEGGEESRTEEEEGHEKEGVESREEARAKGRAQRRRAAAADRHYRQQQQLIARHASVARAEHAGHGGLGSLRPRSVFPGQETL